MAINFMPELDNTGRLEALLDNPEHIKRMSDVNPHEDYSNWKDKKSIIKLMNVNFDAREHVVQWKDEQSRDNWFDKQNDGCYTYDTNWNELQLENFSPSLGTYEGNIIVPLTLEQALGYNYVMIDRYQQPVEQDANSVVRSRYFFFITGIDKDPVAPNTTSLIIELDAWTQYTYEGFETMAGDLKRGHWPIDKISTKDYLANPLDCPVNIFADEPTLPEVKPKVSYEKMATVYNDPVIIIASTMDFKNDTGFSDNQNHTPDEQYWWLDYKNNKYLNKYSDTSNLNMDYLASVDPKYVDDGADYDIKDAHPLGRATRKTINDDDQNITGIFYYILELDQYENFIVTLRRYYPQIYSTLMAMFVLPRNYVLQGDKFTSTFNIDMQYAHQQNQLRDELDLKITPDMFGYKTDFTKLYTAQFSQLEISDLNGTKKTLDIEDTSGTLSFMFRTNLMFPFLKMEGFINGIGGSMANHYTLAPLHPEDYQLFTSNWEDFHFEWNIPTYGIYADSKSLTYTLGQRLQRDYAFAKLEYDNTQVNIDKLHANSFNDIETAYKTGMNSAETAKDNANASNDTSFSNSLRSASNAKTNAQLSADNTKTTSDEEAETTKDTSLNSINNTKTTADESNDTSQETSQRSIDNAKTTSDRSVNNEASNADADIQNINELWGNENSYIQRGGEIAGGATAIGAVAGVVVGVSQGKPFFAPTGGGGDAIGLANKAGAGALSVAETTATTINDANKAGNDKDANVKKTTTIKSNNQSTGLANNSNNQTTDTANNNQQHSTQANINSQNQATDTANTNEVYNTAMTVNGQNYATAVSILNNNYNTAVANATANHDTQASNIARTYNTTVENLNLDQAKGLKNLDNDIKTQENNNEVEYQKKLANLELDLTLGLDSPVRAETNNTGDATMDAWGRRGFDIRINRITVADEQTVVNEFKRYGYQMPANTWIQSPDFTPISSSYGQRHYSYWQFRDIFAWSTKMSETAKRVIISILMDGVTIYDTPEAVQQSFLE